MLKRAYIMLGVFLAIAATCESRGLNLGPTEMERAASARTSQTGNQITGLIMDTSRRPVEKLRVELLNDVDGVLQTARTDSTGRYRFSGLSSGTFQVRVYTSGTNYVEPPTERISIVNFNRDSAGVGGAQFMQVDFTLRPRADGGERSGSGVVFAQDVPEPARKLFLEGVKQLEAKDEKQGLENIKKSIETFPNYFAALEKLGTEYAKRERYLAAAIVLTKAVEVNPKADQSLYWLGISHYKLNQTAPAIAALKRAISLVPNSINSSMALGIALYAEGQMDESEAQFKQAYKLAKSNGQSLPVVHLHLAQLYDKTKRYKEEASELELYLQEQPNDPNAATYRKAVENLKRKAKQ